MEPRQGARADEDGFTLIELLVSMALFSIFVVLLLTAVVNMAQGTVRAQNRSDATNDSLIVFLNFDRQVRYAEAVNFPGPGTSGARYIEFRTPATSTPSGIAQCTQWRWAPSSGLIESRQWDDVVGSTKPDYFTKLSDATSTGDADFPFKLLPANAETRAQQVQLTIGAGGAEGTTAVTVFVARNSSVSSPSNDQNAAGQSSNPVCAFAGSRP